MTEIQSYAKGKVLVTGASDGLGLVLARYYVKAGWTVVATGRRKQSALPDSFPNEAIYIQVDQNQKDMVSQFLISLEKAQISSFDLAILNAGTGYVCETLPEGLERIEETLRVNLYGTLNLVHALAPFLLKEKANKKDLSHIVMIGSTAHKGAKTFPSYAASKAGLNGFARALSAEWSGRCHVQMLHPGPIRTNMHAKAGLDTSRLSWIFLPSDWVATCIVHSARRTRARMASIGHFLYIRDSFFLHWPLRNFKKVLAS